jgi:hypothetical protein
MAMSLYSPRLNIGSSVRLYEHNVASPHAHYLRWRTAGNARPLLTGCVKAFFERKHP